jgi:hypothetical protein
MSSQNISNPDSTRQTRVTEPASGMSTKTSAGRTPPSEPTRSTSSQAVTQTIAAPPSANLVRIQWIVGAVMVAIAVFAAARLWMIEGLIRVARVDGPSMASAFLGAHYRVTCEDCRFVWRCDAEHAPASRQASCPNCGYPTNALRDEDLVEGERVLIDHWPIATRGARRGEVVAAPDPAHPGGMIIKRVAAQPGQQLSIRAGDLIVDGQLARKSWPELAQARVLVHDNSYQPQKSSGVPDRWQDAPGSANSNSAAWHAAMTGFHCQPTQAGEWSWLEYTHHQMFGWHSRTRQSPVLDLDSYNPSETRLLNSVPDVLVSCRLRNLGPGAGQFALAAIDGDQRFEAIIDPQKQTAELVAIGTQGNRQVVARQPNIFLDMGRRGIAIDFGLCDQQVILRLAGRQLFRYAYERSPTRRDTMHPLAIGSQGLDLAVDELRVWRDIYYLAPDNTGRDWTLPAAASAQALTLLGDNTSVSVDSRNWNSGVSPAVVRGLVYRPFWSRR